MEKRVLKLSTQINAPREQVWNVLLGDETYRQWTSVFHPGSYAVSDWQEGSKAIFTSPEGQGLVSRVVTSKPNEIISFEHIGQLKNGVEDYDSEEMNSWKGFRETYYLEEKDGGTQLTIEQDLSSKEIEWFTTAWEKALQKVKEISEASALQPQ